MKFLKKSVKGIIDIAVIPLEVTKDLVTLGGVMTENESTYTGNRLRSAAKNFSDAYDSIDE